MSRYDVSEDEFEPGSDGTVLKNHYGISDAREIQTLETIALFHAQARFYEAFDLAHRFTVHDIKQMHKDWLSPIYPFAGELRTVNLSKGGYWFAAAQFLPGNLAKFESEVLAAHTPCISKSVAEAAESLAIVHGEFITIHPFREGNGRLGRWLADSMAAQARLALPEYGFRADDANGYRHEYLEGVKGAMALEYGPLKRFFLAALERGEATAQGRTP